jgi:ketosteroid isomerase-like protein
VIRIAFLSLLCAASMAQAQDAPNSVHSEIESLERQLSNATVANDVAAVNRLFAAEFYTVSATGSRVDIGNQTPGPVNVRPNGHGVLGRLEKMEVSDLRVRSYGDSVVATFKYEVDTRAPNGDVTSRSLVTTHVWVRRDGRWQLAVSHSTFL